MQTYSGIIIQHEFILLNCFFKKKALWFMQKFLKNWTLKTLFPHFTGLVLNQSPISADFD